MLVRMKVVIINAKIQIFFISIQVGDRRKDPTFLKRNEGFCSINNNVYLCCYLSMCISIELIILRISDCNQFSIYNLSL